MLTFFVASGVSTYSAAPAATVPFSVTVMFLFSFMPFTLALLLTVPIALVKLGTPGRIQFKNQLDEVQNCRSYQCIKISMLIDKYLSNSRPLEELRDLDRLRSR